MKPETNLRMLTIKATATTLGVPVATIYRLVAEKRLAHVRLVGGQHPRIYIREVDLAAFIDSCRVPAEAAQRTADVSWAAMVPKAQRQFS